MCELASTSNAQSQRLDTRSARDIQQRNGTQILDKGRPNSIAIRLSIPFELTDLVRLMLSTGVAKSLESLARMPSSAALAAYSDMAAPASCACTLKMASEPELLPLPAPATRSARKCVKIGLEK
jgi:hypothetical protein